MYIMDGLVLIRGHVVPRTPTPTHYSLPLHAVGYIFGALYQVYCYTPAPCEHVRHLSSAPAFLWSRDILQAFTCRPLLLFVCVRQTPRPFDSCTGCTHFVHVVAPIKRTYIYIQTAVVTPWCHTFIRCVLCIGTSAKKRACVSVRFATLVEKKDTD